MKLKWSYAIAALLVSLVAMPAAAQQQRGVIELGQVATIDQPGHYMLVRDIQLNGSRLEGFTITADGVTLDLNGHEINGPGGKLGTGVHVNGAEGVKVVNGNLSDLAFGVIVEDSHNVEVTDLLIRGMGLIVTALPPEVGVMVLQSSNVVVEDNSIYNTGLGIFVRGSRSTGNRIANNTLTAGTNGLLGICYNPAPDDPMGPRGDLVENNLISGFNLGLQMKAVAFNNVIRDNVVVYGGDQGLDIQNDSHIVMNNAEIPLP